MKSIVYSYCEADISIFIGCTTSALDGNSPRGYSRIFFEYRIKRLFFFFCRHAMHKTILNSCPYLILYLIRCATNSPDESSPRGVRVVDHRLKNSSTSSQYLGCVWDSSSSPKLGGADEVVQNTQTPPRKRSEAEDTPVHFRRASEEVLRRLHFASHAPSRIGIRLK
jgi:hypothetical protein